MPTKLTAQGIFLIFHEKKIISITSVGTVDCLRTDHTIKIKYKKIIRTYGNYKCVIFVDQVTGIGKCQCRKERAQKNHIA